MSFSDEPNRTEPAPAPRRRGRPPRAQSDKADKKKGKEPVFEQEERVFIKKEEGGSKPRPIRQRKPKQEQPQQEQPEGKAQPAGQSEGQEQEQKRQNNRPRPQNENQGGQKERYSEKRYDKNNRRDTRQGGRRHKNRRNYEGKNKQGQGQGQDGNAQQAPARAYVPVGEPREHTGLLIITPKNFGFVREIGGSATPKADAVYVPADLIARYHLRPYVQITGMAQQFERGDQMISITSVNGMDPVEAAALPHFDELKACNPTHRLAFETDANRYTTRTLDLVAPVGRGQRGLIVAPPRTGKTTLLMHIAQAAQENYEEDLHLLILLVDERPEEVTEFKRELPHAEVFASSNDSNVREHCQTAEICIERAKRLVEGGKHVLILLDSITRLARAYNNDQRGSGRTMSGGIDARALEMPRRLFAAARNTRTAGSLTILATALIETNSRMDDLIFQEFKGTGNMELVLNRRIAEMYIYPAVDILKSGTRREELILAELSLDKIRLIRRALAGHKPVEAMERLLFFLRKYPNNAQMLLDLKSR